MYHNFLIHSSVEEHLGYFHVLAIVNSVVMKLGVHLSLSVLVSSVCMPRSGITGLYGSWLIGKDTEAGRDWGQEEKGTTQDEMAGWHHGLDGRVWVNSGRWWWTGRPGVLRFMGLQRVGHNWETELNWTELKWSFHCFHCYLFLSITCECVSVPN